LSEVLQTQTEGKNSEVKQEKWKGRARIRDQDMWEETQSVGGLQFAKYFKQESFFSFNKLYSFLSQCVRTNCKFSGLTK
jgi:hypothetical protein